VRKLTGLEAPGALCMPARGAEPVALSPRQATLIAAAAEAPWLRPLLYSTMKANPSGPGYVRQYNADVIPQVRFVEGGR